MKNTESSVVGQWRITSMEAWDADYIDMEVPAYITVLDNLTGTFQFGLVQGELDGCVTVVDGEVRIEFAWSVFSHSGKLHMRMVS